jgi:hypothetical protein
MDGACNVLLPVFQVVEPVHDPPGDFAILDAAGGALRAQRAGRHADHASRFNFVHQRLNSQFTIAH